MFPRRPWMTPWYSPTLLAKAGVEVVVSTLFGQHADQRTMQALAGPATIHDYSGSLASQTRIHPTLVVYSIIQHAKEAKDVEEDFWIDYVADVGDGWDSTYSIAYLVTRPTLLVTDHNGTKQQPLPQGR